MLWPESVEIYIGCPYLKEQELKRLYEIGHKVVIFDDIGQYPEHHYFYDYILVQEMGPEEIVTKIEVWKKGKNIFIHSVFTNAEGSVNTCNEIAHLLGLAPISFHRNINLRDKFRVREQMNKTEFLIPLAEKISNPDKVKEYHQDQFPLIVKPIDSMASRNVKISYNNKELKEAIDNIFTQKTIVTLQGRAVNVEEVYGLKEMAVIESYIEGEEISLEVLYLKGEMIGYYPTLKITCGAPYFQEQGHISGPLRLSEKQIVHIENLLKALNKIQQFHTTILHVELKLLENDQVSLIECNNRAAGDGILELVEYSTGVNLLDALLARNCELPETFKRKACRIFLSTEETGCISLKKRDISYGKLNFYYDDKEMIKPLITEKMTRVGSIVIQEERGDKFDANYQKLMLQMDSFFSITSSCDSG